MGIGEYNFDDFDFKKGNIVIDIGGKIRMTSIYLIKKFLFIKIFSFEPERLNYNFLKYLN